MPPVRDVRDPVLRRPWSTRVVAGIAWGIAASVSLGCKPTDVDIGLGPVQTYEVRSQGTGQVIEAPCQKGVVGSMATVEGLAAQPLVVDGLSIYVVAAARSGDPSRQDLWRVPKMGPAAVAAPERRRIAGLDVGGLGSVFWSEGGAGADGGETGNLWRLDPSSTSPAIVAADRPEPGALIVVGDRVYWAERGVDAVGQPYGAIMWTAAYAPGPVEMLQQMDATQMPKSFDLLYSDCGPLTTPNVPEVILTWTTFDPALGNQSTAQVSGCSLPLPLSTVAPFVAAGTGAAGVETIAGDQGSLFYSGPQGIMQATLEPDGGFSVAAPFVATAGYVDRIESDPTMLYFVDPSTGALTAAGVGADAGPPLAIATEVDPSAAFDVDTTCAYWTDVDAGAVRMVRK